MKAIIYINKVLTMTELMLNKDLCFNQFICLLIIIIVSQPYRRQNNELQKAPLFINKIS
jgi:hypothetical protein